MPQIFGVNISKASFPNAEYSLLEGRSAPRCIWGWKAGNLERKNGGFNAHGEVANSMRPGDFVVFAWGARDPRRPQGSWADERFAGTAVAVVTKSLYRKDDIIWPDEIAGEMEYELCIDLELRSEQHFANPQPLYNADFHEAVRRSGAQSNVPVRLAMTEDALPREVFVDFDPDTRVSLPKEIEDGEDMAPASSPSVTEFSHSGDYNTKTLVNVRREQAKLRNFLFGIDPDSLHRCHLCGRELPARLLRAAHIKRRESCSTVELGDINNLMRACTLGCDELFERKYIVVNDNGFIERVTRRVSVGDLEDILAGLEGQSVRGFSSANEHFFAWHRATLST